MNKGELNYKSNKLTTLLSELEFYERVVRVFGDEELISKVEIEKTRNFILKELKEFLANPSPDDSSNY